MYNSTCPHHYVLNTDSNRKPETIIEVRYNCKADQPFLDSIEVSRYMPVKYFIPVLLYNGHRHKCAAFRYSQTTEEITVGCILSHAINSRVLTSTNPFINTAMHVLLMHGFAVLRISIPGRL